MFPDSERRLTHKNLLIVSWCLRVLFDWVIGALDMAELSSSSGGECDGLPGLGLVKCADALAASWPVLACVLVRERWSVPALGAALTLLYCR